MEAGDLVVGEEIRTAEWETGTVEAVYIVTQPQPMYNFTVAAAHTYFVGDGQWLVHNACPIIGNSSVADIAGNTPIRPSAQGSVTPSRVEKYITSMLNGSFDWDNMADPMVFARNTDDSLSIMDGHHRFLASQYTGTPIPWNNPEAVRIEEFGVDWPMTASWLDIIWDGH